MERRNYKRERELIEARVREVYPDADNVTFELSGDDYLVAVHRAWGDGHYGRRFRFEPDDVDKLVERAAVSV